MKTPRSPRAHPYLAPLVVALALTSGCRSPQKSESPTTTLTLPESTSTTGEVAPVAAPQEKPVPTGIYKKVGHATKKVGSKPVILDRQRFGDDNTDQRDGPNRRGNRADRCDDTDRDGD